MENRFADAPSQAIPLTDINVVKQHLCFLLDSSSSTLFNPNSNAQTPHNALMEGMQRFYDRVMESKAARRSVDITIHGFNQNVWTIQNTRPISEMQPVEFKAEGATDINKAIAAGVASVKAVHEAYTAAGVLENKAMLVLITDGDDTITGNLNEACGLIKQIKGLAKLYVLRLGALEEGDANVAKLCAAADGWGFELPLAEIRDIYDFFNLLSDSAVSASEPGSPNIETPIGIEGQSQSGVVAKSFHSWVTEVN